MIYKAGQDYYAEFVTTSPSTGGAMNADALPVATATVNGVDDAGFALTVANLDAGRYKITGVVPAYAAGTRVQVSIAATVGTIAGKAVVDSFTVEDYSTTDVITELPAVVEAAVISGINSIASSYYRTESALLADGTEQIVYENSAPVDTWIPDNINISLEEMQAGDAVTIRIYLRDKDGGSYRLYDTQNYSGVQSVTGISVRGVPNRYGLKLTLEQTAGTYRTFDSEAMVIT